jgi:hypothetical protein
MIRGLHRPVLAQLDPGPPTGASEATAAVWVGPPLPAQLDEATAVVSTGAIRSRPGVKASQPYL